MESIAAALELLHRGRAAEAEAACERMLASATDRCDALTLLAELRSSSGRIDGAIGALRELAVLRPRDGGNLRRLAAALLSLGKPADAAEVLRRAVAVEPDNVRGHNNLGQTLLQLGELPEALACFERSLEIEPGYAIGRLNIALTLERMGQPGPALLQYERLSRSHPANADAWARGGALLLRLDRAAEALESFENALALRPQDADILRQKAAALVSLERPAEALAAANAALARRETSAMILHIKAAALSRLHRPVEALVCMERALELEPADVEAWCHRAIVHLRLTDRAAAARCYRRALELDPACLAARTGLISGLIPAVPTSAAESVQARAALEQELAAFEGWLEEREIEAQDAWTVAREPFFYLSYEDQCNKDLLQRYRRASSVRLTRLAGLMPPSSRGRTRPRFRLGIVSAHVCDHSVFNAIVRGWLERFDRNRFETSLFHLGGKRDAVTEAAERAVDRFEASPHTLPDWAALIRDRDLDALIFPEVGIHKNSLALANLRLARRQFACWGHPETTGLPTIDAFLSAEAFEPTNAQEHYSEQLVRLPNLGVYHQRDPADPVPVDFAALGIPTNGPVFVCPGTPFKYRPEDDAVLVEIALRVPRSTFVFFTYERQELSKLLRRRLSAAFVAADLRPERALVWIPWQPRPAFLGVLNQADVYLDTIGFSGFNTIMQAIAVHLPCVAHEGRFMRGRLGSGVLRRLELHELVAERKSDYVDIAVRLASDRVYRTQIARRMRLAESRAYADQDAVEALQRLLLA